MVFVLVSNRVHARLLSTFPLELEAGQRDMFIRACAAISSYCADRDSHTSACPIARHTHRLSCAKNTYIHAPREVPARRQTNCQPGIALELLGRSQYRDATHRIHSGLMYNAQHTQNKMQLYQCTASLQVQAGVTDGQLERLGTSGSSAAGTGKNFLLALRPG